MPGWPPGRQKGKDGGVNMAISRAMCQATAEKLLDMKWGRSCGMVHGAWGYHAGGDHASREEDHAHVGIMHLGKMVM